MKGANPHILGCNICAITAATLRCSSPQVSGGSARERNAKDIPKVEPIFSEPVEPLLNGSGFARSRPSHKSYERKVITCCCHLTSGSSLNVFRAKWHKCYAGADGSGTGNWRRLWRMRFVISRVSPKSAGLSVVSRLEPPSTTIRVTFPDEHLQDSHQRDLLVQLLGNLHLKRAQGLQEASPLSPEVDTHSHRRP